MGLDSTGSSPVFPNMNIDSYTYFFNQLRVTSAQRKLYFETRLTTKTKSLALLLVQLNVLRRFQKIDNGYYRVFPAYSRFRKQARSIKTFTRSRGRHRFKLSTIRTLNLNTPHTHYILETDRGLMTHKDAIKGSLGGLLLVIVH